MISHLPASSIFVRNPKKAKMVSSSADRKSSRVQKFSALATGGVLSKEGIETFFFSFTYHSKRGPI